MSGQPDPGQRALLGQHEVGVEHHAPNFWRPTSKSHKVHGSFRGPIHKKRGFSTFYFYFQNYSFAAVVKQSRWPPNIARTIACIKLLINFYSSHHWSRIKQHSDIYVLSFRKLTYHLLTRRGRFFFSQPIEPVIMSFLSYMCGLYLLRKLSGHSAAVILQFLWCSHLKNNSDFSIYKPKLYSASQLSPLHMHE